MRRAEEKSKMPMQGHNNGLGHCPDVKDNQCPFEVTLVSQILRFMFIVYKTKGVQHELNGQCILVPANCKKI